MAGQGDRGRISDFLARDHGKKEVLETPCWGSRNSKSKSCRRESIQNVRIGEDPDWVRGSRGEIRF
jgi:hypothetical protein